MKPFFVLNEQNQKNLLSIKNKFEEALLLIMEEKQEELKDKPAQLKHKRLEKSTRFTKFKLPDGL